MLHSVIYFVRTRLGLRLNGRNLGSNSAKCKMETQTGIHLLWFDRIWTRSSQSVCCCEIHFLCFFFPCFTDLSCCNSKLNSLRNQVSSAYSGSYLALTFRFCKGFLCKYFQRTFILQKHWKNQCQLFQRRHKFAYSWCYAGKSVVVAAVSLDSE